MMLLVVVMVMGKVLYLDTEISRIDCRLKDIQGMMRYFCILDRVDAETIQITGVTFRITRALVTAFIDVALLAGFKYIQYERMDAVGQVARRIRYDMKNSKFIKIGE